MKDTAIRVTLGEVLVIITVMVAFYASNVLAIQPDAGQQGVDFEKIAKAAAAGDAIQQYNYGVMHETGQGVQQSMATAVEWYAKSAAQGYENAQYNLGVMYLRGLGVDKNIPRAIELFEKAAAQQNLSAIEALEILKNQKQ
ncbi:MAG TPA: hypothetical protein DCF62_04405 [Porticoccaceae bacterium]|nr:hypothetical protein [Porticoccaceae bacterium]